MKRDLFWKLLEPEHAKAESFCRKLARDRHEADDLYQDALVSALKGFGSLQNTDSFRPWLYRIIVNKFKSLSRKPWWRKQDSLEDLAEHEKLSYNPANMFDSRRWLEKAFSAISPAERALITLFELEGWRIGELAAMFGKPKGTIKSRLSRARMKMRKEISRSILREEKNNLIARSRVCAAGKHNID